MPSRLLFGVLLFFISFAAQASPGLVDSAGVMGVGVAGIRALPTGAIAKSPEAPKKYKEPLPTWKDIEFSFGLKVGGGGDLWLSPSNPAKQMSPEYTFTMPIFEGVRGGYNYTVGFFGDLRLFRYLGVESGIVLTRHTLRENTDWTYREPEPSNVVLKSRSEETLTWGALRIPVMFRFVAPVGDNHLWFGAGPEFSFGQWARGNMTISSKGADLQGEREKLQETFDGCSKEEKAAAGGTCPGLGGESPLEGVPANETWLTFGFGYMIQAAPNLKIPIDLRFGWNPDQPKDYYERLSFCPDNLPCNTLPLSATDEERFVSRVLVKAQSSMYAELLVGLLYNLY